MGPGRENVARVSGLAGGSSFFRLYSTFEVFVVKNFMVIK